MFSGIIEVVGRIVSLDRTPDGGVRLILDAAKLARFVRKGDSIAVDGVCLTVVQKTGKRVAMDVSAETLSLTNVPQYKKGSRVNLELPLKSGAMISGHFVQGHVDGVGHVCRWICNGNQDVRLGIALPTMLVPYCILKGSIAINGVSLTIAKLKGKYLEVALIPYTLGHTNLGLLEPGNPVNIETDVLGRYVVSLVKKAYHMRKKGS
jgi:riboflavin synthase